MPSLRRVEFILVFALTAIALIGSSSVSAQITFTDINPNQSSLDPSDADGASGGRVNGLAITPGNNQIFYAASEWGGIYRSNDGGLNWNRLNNHRPTVTWDVEVSPTNVNLIFATSFYDGRVNSESGINVSTDSGATWTHPATATPPVGFCSNARRSQPAAFGIAIDPANAQNVYIGTNCGLAISNDGGTTWTFVDPTPGDLADNVWDVVVHHGGIIDLVGDDGHQRSIDGGANWTTATGTPLPSGRASITASPDEQDVIFSTSGNNVWESDDAGANWTNLGTPDSRRQGRVPFVAVNDRAGNAFDLWYGDVRLFRGGCTSNPMGGGLRCPTGTVGPIPTPAPPTPAGWAGPFTRDVGGHDDVGDIVFDTTVATDACPRMFASDGGVYFNTVAASPGCHTPAWEQPNVTPHGTWLWSLVGADQGGVATEDLYFGLQDNGSYGATNGGAAIPTWTNRDCCDIFDTSAEPARVLYTFCCGGGRATSLIRRGSGMVGGGGVNDPADYPADGLLPGFIFPDIITRFSASSYAIITRDCTPPNGIDDDGDGMVDEADETGGCTGVNAGDGGIYLTSNIAASPIVWAELGPATEPPTGGGGACAIKSATMGGTTSFFVQVGACTGRDPAQLWRFDGTNPAGAWTQVNLPPGGIGIFDVDPNNPNRIIASQLNGSNVNMVLTTNGGTTWTTLAALDNLMTGGGTYLYRNTRGSAPGSASSHSGYVQPTLVAFDPSDGNTIIAGGADSGVFLSNDAGNIWTTLTDNSGGASNPHLPRPSYAYFDREGGLVNIYVGTVGRGVWRISFQAATANLAITKTAAPNPVVTGTNLTYTINVTNNGPDAAESVTVVDNLPATINFVSCAVAGGTGGVCGGAGNNRTVTFTSLAANAVATITLVANVSCALADGTMISNTASVSSLATDPNLANNSATAIAIASNPPPVINLNPPISLWPPNHNYHTVTVAQMVASVSDNCPLSDQVAIEKVTSDEPDNSIGEGNTVNDIVIAPDCQSVQLRSERAGPNDGRVYAITLRLMDSGGAVTRVDFLVSVPKSQNGTTAVKSPTALTILSGCP